MKVQFAGQSARDADNPAGNSSRLVNGYREPMIPGGRGSALLRGCPGMADFAEVNDVFVRAMSNFDDGIMAIVGMGGLLAAFPAFQVHIYAGFAVMLVIGAGYRK